MGRRLLAPLTDVKKGLEQGSLKFEIDGIRLKGKWALVRMDDRGDGKDNWLLIKEKDGFAATGVSPEFDSSVRTGRTMDEITRGEEKSFSKNPFDKTEAQLAKLSTEIPKGSEWVFEGKVRRLQDTGIYRRQHGKAQNPQQSRLYGTF